MPGDPQVLKVTSEPGMVKNTFTGIRATFPNLAIHKLISEEFLPFRKALSRRPEFQTQGLWEGPLVTFVHQYLDRITNSIRQATHKDVSDVNTPLVDRVATLTGHVDRMIGTEDLESIAQDFQATHSDQMLNPAMPRVQSLTFTWEGTDPDIPQPTPGRYKDASARVLMTGLDLWVVEMTNSPSSNAQRTINRNDAGIWITWMADLYNIATRAATDQTPYIPEALDRSQYDAIWNADGSKDTPVVDGAGGQGEQV